MSTEQMTLGESYILASRVRSKLTKHASDSRVGLRVLVTQANMLDNVMDHIDAEHAKRRSTAQNAYKTSIRFEEPAIKKSRGRGTSNTRGKTSVTEYEVDSESDSDSYSDSDSDSDSDYEMETYQDESLAKVSDMQYFDDNHGESESESDSDSYESDEEYDEQQAAEAIVRLAELGKVQSSKSLPYLNLGVHEEQDSADNGKEAGFSSDSEDSDDEIQTSASLEPRVDVSISLPELSRCSSSSDEEDMDESHDHHASHNRPPVLIHTSETNEPHIDAKSALGVAHEEPPAVNKSLFVR
ncbi:Piso0_002754 [Millerozyma farinosa CBS 7064]|uniref:Piso0_002754 protein n=1 Tax=Pichia sorbitophila (strain ATCC MYA-4447 / BCRC 22081 / CBS 7064 / NBRC 10061 / NRRL Y-12695) TaxID=559304 RepID=G8YDF2_PICSO|nr:Piso0_002754 [Millerozyma farinosa CBS 7064]